VPRRSSRPRLSTGQFDVHVLQARLGDLQDVEDEAAFEGPGREVVYIELTGGEAGTG